MMKTMSISDIYRILLLLFLLSAVTVIRHLEAVGNAQLYTICSKTTNPSFCMRALKADRRTASSDIRGLGYVSIDLARSKGMATLSHINSLSRKATATSDGKLKRRLRVCSDYYTSATALLDEAKRSLGSGDYGSVADKAASAMDRSESCEDEFEGGPPVVPELKQMNNDMEDLCTIVFEVAANMG